MQRTAFTDVSAAEQRAPEWSADWRIAVGITEAHSLLAEAIQIRGADPGTDFSQGVFMLLVGKNEDDIHRLECTNR